YCFGPTFRAEKSKTRRHLLEFWMLEMEAAFYEHDDSLRFQEEMLAYTVKRILGNRLSDLHDLERDPAKLEPATETPYPRVRYGEALKTINDSRYKGFQVAQPMYSALIEREIENHPGTGQVVDDGILSPMPRSDWERSLSDFFVNVPESFGEEVVLETHRLMPFHWGNDFGAPDETAIGAKYDRPVFVTNFPVEAKGFYFKDELDADGNPIIDPAFKELPDHLKLPGMSGHTIMGADCIGPEGAGELIGGSQREDDYDRLVAKIKHHELPMEYLEWYLDVRRYGNVPHSGFGIGLERFLCWICGGSDTPVHIRETIPFPRMLHQMEP
ncbi:hypothetical protein IIA79_06850, partial [bacterium]|nr:hypothetical protein [bacterium]